MTVRIDVEEKTLKCSVRDLAADEERGSIGGGMLRMGRARIGRDVHQRRQEAQESERDYRREVSINQTFEIDDWTVTVRGRIDGIYEKDGSTIVEEIKSVILAPEEFSKLKPARYAMYVRQLEFYLYFLKKQEDVAAAGRLVFVNYPDGEVREFDIKPDLDDVEQSIRRAVKVLIEEALVDEREKDARRASVEKIVFPYEAVREWQDVMVEQVEAVCNSGGGILVSAPAGIGKTAAALYSSLRAAFACGRTVFFVTPKRTQQALVAETLKAMQEAGAPITSVTLAAKERMCPTGEVFCHPEVCAFAGDFYRKLVESTVIDDLLRQGIILPDEIYKRAVAEILCPFEVSLELTTRTDVVIGDYNYVFDPVVALSRFFDEDTYDHLICIVDEAHNLYSRGCDYYSPRISRSHGRELAMKLLHEPGLPQDFVRWLRSLDKLFKAARERAKDSEISYPDESEYVIDLDPEPFARVRRRLDMLVLEHLTEKRRKRIIEKEDPILDFYFAFTRFERVLSLKGPEFAYIMRLADEEEKDILRILCKDPSGQLAERVSGFHAAVGMSATLSPMTYYRDVLGFPRETELCDLPSPFPPENRKVIIVDSVDTTYRRRESFAPDIAGCICECAALRPGNYFAFFPSFKYMESVAEYVRLPGFRIERQERNMDERARRKFLAMLEGPGSHLMLGVQGGIFAEGVDYPGEMLVGVFIVSPALPRYGLDTELMKQYYHETREKGFEYAYLYPGMNRVIQASGRVHRSAEDRGIIMLLCKRFAWKQYAECIPSYWYTDSPRELIAKEPADQVAEFWRAGTGPEQ
ncbi:MAG: hypothetical protein E3J72_15780 [Planctomycetota bacterium]|nr:MAG: hypothetical protein E3J72_15780 [Planctomycetota bacterium]